MLKRIKHTSMRKIVLIMTLILGAFTVQAQDVTVEEILDTYFENVGGREAWSALENYTWNAKASAQGMDIPFTMIAQKDGKTLTKISFQGQEFIQGAYDGECMWGVNFMTQKAEKMESEEVENHQRTIGEFPDPLLTYKEMGYTVELAGTATQEGVECYKVKMTKKKQLIEGEEKDNIVYYYFDQDNFVPIMQEEPILTGEMAGKTAQTMFSDYQEIGDGMYYPFAVTSQIEGMGGQTLQIESVEINTEIDQSIFNFPTDEEK